MPQYTVLAALDREGDLSSSDLARELGMTAQTVNVLVKGLEAAGPPRPTLHPSPGGNLSPSPSPSRRPPLSHQRAPPYAPRDRRLSGLLPAVSRMPSPH